MKKEILLYKRKKNPSEIKVTDFAEKDISESTVLRELATMPSIGEVISVRAAKAHLSGLLDLVERGREIIITSNGKPKARLVSLDGEPVRKPFGISKNYTPAPWRGGKTSEELIREDRDGRGW